MKLDELIKVLKTTNGVLAICLPISGAMELCVKAVKSDMIEGLEFIRRDLGPQHETNLTIEVDKYPDAPLNTHAQSIYIRPIK